MNIKCSLHTHTTYCDGKSTPREMVESAIALGCHTLGFSGHSRYATEDLSSIGCMSAQKEQEYRQEILALREEYRGRLNVLLGLERDAFSPKPDFAYDYVIGSVHFVKKNGEYIMVDYTPEHVREKVDALYGGDLLAYAKDYYTSLVEFVESSNCDIVGHFDLLTKFDEKRPLFDASNKAYRTIACEALDALIDRNALFEVNTGAISRKWRTTPYPNAFLMKRIAEKNGNVIITADAHHADHILCAYDLARSMLKENGVKNIYTVENGKFVLADM